MTMGLRGISGIALLGLMACGGSPASDAEEVGMQTRGVVHEVTCDGDRGGLTLDSPIASEPLVVELAPDATIDEEPIPPGCEGLGQTLGSTVEVIGRRLTSGSMIADRVEVAD